MFFGVVLSLVFFNIIGNLMINEKSLRYCFFNKRLLHGQFYIHVSIELYKTYNLNIVICHLNKYCGKQHDDGSK